MPASLSEWDAKHQAAAEEPPPEPASFVLELLPLLPLGPALDLACGTGRHTLLLASRHQPVTAVDGSAVALGVLERRGRGLPFRGKRILDAPRGAGPSDGHSVVHPRALPVPFVGAAVSVVRFGL